MTADRDDRVRFAQAALSEVERRFVNTAGPGLDVPTLEWAARQIAGMRQEIALSAEAAGQVTTDPADGLSPVAQVMAYGEVRSPRADP